MSRNTTETSFHIAKYEKVIKELRAGIVQLKDQLHIYKGQQKMSTITSVGSPHRSHVVTPALPMARGSQKLDQLQDKAVLRLKGVFAARLKTKQDVVAVCYTLPTHTCTHTHAVVLLVPICN